MRTSTLLCTYVVAVPLGRISMQMTSDPHSHLWFDADHKKLAPFVNGSNFPRSYEIRIKFSAIMLYIYIHYL